MSYHSRPVLSALRLLAAVFLGFATSAPAEEGPPASGSGEYRIGPEDILQVSVLGNEDLNQTVLVQADGSFLFPLVGRMQAADRTPAQLERELAQRLGDGFIRDPQVTVIVREYRSKIVFVVGELSRPGPYPLSGGMRLIEVLARAGPPTPRAGTTVVVVRPGRAVSAPTLPAEGAGKGATEVITVDLRDIEAGRLDKNLSLQAGDTVFVGAAPTVFVSGEVRNPGAYQVGLGTTVRQVVSMAGGFTEHAAEGRLRVIRVVAGRSKELKIKLDDSVQPGDTVIAKPTLF